MKRVLAVNLVLVGIIIGAMLAWACNAVENGGRRGSGFGPGDANAQSTTEPGCSQWEIRMLPSATNWNGRGTLRATLEAGYEPLAIESEGPDGYDVGILAKKCLD